MSKIFPNSRQRRKDANDMDAIKRRQDARRFIEKQQELEDLIMDSELTALEQKLTKARALKQGMMQQLLTGRIRLPLPQEA